jgi:acyl-CoA synthetase (NDP forming)/RimJ/RimL family protein N-acetyltransferase
VTDEYPPHWEADVVVSDGSTAHLRPIVPADADRILALHSRLSERTRYLRYFGPYPRIPARDLEHFTHVDYRDRVALVAELGADLIAVCRYDRLVDTSDAEVAFVVEDAHQGHGLGSVLLEHLAAAARERGISRFVAEVLAENPRMARVFIDAGYQAKRSFEGGVVHLVFPIEPTERQLAVAYEREQRAEARSIQRLLTPESVAVIGASHQRGKAGNILLTHLRDAGFVGELIAVNRRADPVLDLPTYPELTRQVDLAVIAVPATEVRAAVDQCAAHGVRSLVVVSAGFAERDESGRRLQGEVITAARRGGMRMLGPNCLGALNTDPAIQLNASLAPVSPRRGPIGFFCQSGALGIMTLGEMHARGLGLSTFVSAGNRADVSGNDLLQYWAEDPATDVVLMWLESFGNPRKFTRLARRVARRKPVVLLGRGPSSAVDPAHSRRLLADLGLISVDTLAEQLDVATLLAYQPLPPGDRLAIVGNASAPGVLAAEACRNAGLRVASGYPVDVGPWASTHALAGKLAAAAVDPAVDAILAVYVPALAGDDDAAAGAIVAAVQDEKPVMATFLGLVGLPDRLGTVPSYPSPERAVQALASAVAYGRWRSRPTGELLELPDIDRDAARHFIAGRNGELTDSEVAILLGTYGIHVWPRRLVSTVDEAIEVAAELGYPVALKCVDESLRHRRELGGVALDLADADELRAAFTESPGNAYAVQSMAPEGVPTALTATDDPAFGGLISFSVGGVASELLGDRAYAAVPMTDLDAERLIGTPRAAPLLSGYRGAAPVDVQALQELVLRVARLVEDLPEVLSVELDPVLVGDRSLAVLTASITVGRATARAIPGPRRLRPVP